MASLLGFSAENGAYLISKIGKSGSDFAPESRFFSGGGLPSPKIQPIFPPTGSLAGRIASGGRHLEALETMKKLFVLILLAAAFLAGYYYGHQPNSPDIFGKAQAYYRQASDAGQQLMAVVNGEPENVLSQVSPEKMTVTVDGKKYHLGGKHPKDPDSREE